MKRRTDALSRRELGGSLAPSLLPLLLSNLQRRPRTSIPRHGSDSSAIGISCERSKYP